MATLIETGFEVAVTTDWSTQVGTAYSLDTGTKYAGAQSAYFNKPGSAAYLQLTLTSKRVIVGRVYYRITTDFSGTTPIIMAPNANGNLQISARNGRMLRGEVGATLGSNSAALTAGVWYRIDFKFDSSGATATLDWQIDGSAQTQVSRAQTAADMTTFRLGGSGTNTGQAHFDDLKVTDTAADYPLGASSSPQTLTMGLIDAGRAIYAPTVAPKSTLTMGLIDAGRAIYAPTVAGVGGGAQTLTVGLIDAGRAIYSPTIVRGAGVIKTTGFEGASPAAEFDSVIGSGLTLSTTQGVHAGAQSLLVTGTGTATYGQWTVTGFQQFAARFYVTIVSDASGTASIFSIANANGNLQLMLRSGNALRAEVGSTFGSNSSALSAGPHLIEVAVDFSGATATFDWRIDGAAQTQVSAAHTPADSTQIRVGNTGTNTYVAAVDDFLMVDAASAHPLGGTAAGASTLTLGVIDAGRAIYAPLVSGSDTVSVDLSDHPHTMNLQPSPFGVQRFLRGNSMTSGERAAAVGVMDDIGVELITIHIGGGYANAVTGAQYWNQRDPMDSVGNYTWNTSTNVGLDQFYGYLDELRVTKPNAKMLLVLFDHPRALIGSATRATETPVTWPDDSEFAKYGPLLSAIEARYPGKTWGVSYGQELKSPSGTDRTGTTFLNNFADGFTQVATYVRANLPTWKLVYPHVNLWATWSSPVSTRQNAMDALIAGGNFHSADETIYNTLIPRVDPDHVDYLSTDYSIVDYSTDDTWRNNYAAVLARITMPFHVVRRLNEMMMTHWGVVKPVMAIETYYDVRQQDADWATDAQQAALTTAMTMEFARAGGHHEMRWEPQGGDASNPNMQSWWTENGVATLNTEHLIALQAAIPFGSDLFATISSTTDVVALAGGDKVFLQNMSASSVTVNVVVDGASAGPVTIAAYDYATVDMPLGTVALGLIDAGRAIYSPTVRGKNTMTLGLIDAGRAIYAPTTALRNTLSLGVIDGLRAIYAPVLGTGAVGATLGLIDAGRAIFSPTLARYNSLALGVIDAGHAIYGPVLEVSGTVLSLGVIDAARAIYAPVISTLSRLSLGVIESASAIYSLDVINDHEELSVGLIESVSRIYGIEVTYETPSLMDEVLREEYFGGWRKRRRWRPSAS